jgi:hypothetical protein
MKDESHSARQLLFFLPNLCQFYNKLLRKTQTKGKKGVPERKLCQNKKKILLKE